MVIAVTSVDTQMLFQMDLASAGVRKYSVKLANPTNTPPLSSMLLARIATIGATRKIASRIPAAASSTLPTRSVQWTFNLVTPRTPFVADFVGKTNLLPATRLGENRVQVGAQHFECEVSGALADGSGLRVFFRPEDVQVRGVNGATPNSADAVIEKVEFLGAYSRVAFRLGGIDQVLNADLSENDMSWFRVKPGDTMRLAIPPDRVRVFEAA